MLDLSPMLAERGLPAGSLERWAVEPKLDGWRVTVLVDEKVVVRTRRGHAITETVPGIDALGGTGHRLLLDGELVAGAGRASDFYALLPGVAGGRPTASLSFWAFDLLWLDDELLIDRPYAERRAVLEALALAGPCAVLPRFPGTDATDLLAACVDRRSIGTSTGPSSWRLWPATRPTSPTGASCAVGIPSPHASATSWSGCWRPTCKTWPPAPAAGRPIALWPSEPWAGRPPSLPSPTG